MDGWSLTSSGASWWLVGLLILGSLVMLQRLHASVLPVASDRRLLTLVRGSFLVLVLLMLSEPSLVWRQWRRTPPRVLALIDSSASMATAGERLEAGSLLDLVAMVDGLEAEDRDRQAGAAAAAASALRDLPLGGEDRRADRDLAQERLANLRARCRSWPEVTATLDEAATVLTDEVSRPGSWRDLLGRAAERLTAIQTAADAAWLNSRDRNDPVRRACEAMAARIRLERALLAARHGLSQSTRGRLDVEMAAGAAGMSPIELGRPPVARGETDLARVLEAVYRQDDRRGYDAVVLFTDGRQTVAEDPDPFLRALQARGTLNRLVQVGDERPPPDAVVAAIEAPEDVFRQELVPVQVRYRVPMARGGHFELVLTVDDREIERRQVAPSRDWRYATALLPMPQDGTVTVGASLQAVDDLPRPVPPSGMLMEAWSAADQGPLGLPNSAPDHRAWLDGASFTAQPRAGGLRRLRGTLVPPADGLYRFRLTSAGPAMLSMRHGGRWLELIERGRTTEAQQGDDRLAPSPLLRLHAESAYPIELVIAGQATEDSTALDWRRGDDHPWRTLSPAAFLPPRPSPPPDLRRDNNSALRTLVVHDEPLRILALDRLPRRDLQLLAAMTEREGQLVIERRVLAVQRLRGEGSMLPTRIDDLLSFDAVVVGDLLPQHLQPVQQDILSHYVAAGGSLLIIAGRRAMPGAYHLGRMADLLPVVAEGLVHDGEPVACRLPEGVDHPGLRVLSDVERNRRLWRNLPSLGWAATGVAAKAGARVLLETDDGAPLIATQRYGAGRVVYIGSDETWRWRRGIGGQLQEHLWLRLLRWGTGVPLRGRDPRLQVALERSLIHPGERGVLRVRSDRSLGGKRPHVEVEREGHDQVLPVDYEREGQGTWRVSLPLTAQGRYRFVAYMATPEGSVLVEERQLLVREPAGRELIDLSADRAGLQRLAALGDGDLLRLHETDRLAAELVSVLQTREEVVSRTWSLWDGPLIPVLLLLLLAFEWSWRRWRGLP